MKMLHLTGRLVTGLIFILNSAGALCAGEPIFVGMGSYKRPVPPAAPIAKQYFNQRLAFYHGFNHGAAIRSFQEAVRLDPNCAMAHWGIALASGPHINLPIVPPMRHRA